MITCGCTGITPPCCGSPFITSISPICGPVGTPVTIKGNNFQNIHLVTVNFIDTSFTSVGTNQLNITIPGGLVPGRVPITVSGPCGVSNTISFTVTAGSC